MARAKQDRLSTKAVQTRTAAARKKSAKTVTVKLKSVKPEGKLPKITAKPAPFKRGQTISITWDLKTIYHIDIERLIPYARNSRQHSPHQLKMLRASIREFGFTMPVLVREDMTIIAGHGRALAAQAEGMKQIPCMVAVGWTEAQCRAYVIADNRLTDRSEFDPDMLRAELADIMASGFNSESIGFTAKEIDELLADLKVPDEQDADAVPESAPKVCKPGETWRLGDHLLHCGDATDSHAWDALLPENQSPDLILTDPPYGVPILTNFKLGKRGKVKADGKKFREVIGNEQEFNPVHLYMREPRMVIIWGANHFAHRLPYNGRWLVWDKREDVIPQRTQADCELAWCSVYGAARIFRHYWDGMMKASERGEARVHPTQKPVALMQWCMDFVDGCKVVFDPYGGSGTTLIAAEKTGRACRMIELDPLYCDIIIKRWQDLTGRRAEKVKDGKGKTA